MSNLTPREMVQKMDKYIIGQDKAKRAVAVGIRNRYRRKLVDQEFQNEIKPNNILMMGSTGVGKTEIARRIAMILDTPFVKVEATKFTEVGYVGRDVESMVRDLVEESVRLSKRLKFEEVEETAVKYAEERLMKVIDDYFKKNPTDKRIPEDLSNRKDSVFDEVIEIAIEKPKSFSMVDSLPGMDFDLVDELEGAFSDLFPTEEVVRKMTIREALDYYINEESEKLIDMDEIHDQALRRAEDGIIFIDEIDKVAGSGAKASGPDVSREGVQRDILPIVEGTTVRTKYGNVKTDHMLFIAAGAFHVSKVDDLIPELQGRFPVVVELEKLTEDDFYRILTETDNSLLKQYKLLLETEGLKLEFTDEAIREIAKISYKANENLQNMGARRLQAVIEKLLDEISFHASEMNEVDFVVDLDYVQSNLKDEYDTEDISKYII